MSLPLSTAALLAVGIGVAHSWLGERYILVRLFRRGDLPPLFGSDRFTRRTLRFAWHLTTVAWWGFAAILCVVSGAFGELDLRRATLLAVAGTFAVHAVVTLAASRGRHLAWIVFAAIAALCVLGAR